MYALEKRKNSLFYFFHLNKLTSSPKTALFLSSNIESRRSFFIILSIGIVNWRLTVSIETDLETTNSTRITMTTNR
jgi:hypothetical protein